ncbi:hypothetical protein [Bradyrhizobium centrosematis]|uniref:hypothetical protein n=1 Tax=Bradyrhizobium centrosematis TaxID=1300039 RepID=UPI00216986D9|nr:hypothetical protein [Bradyrhizobium centrosematis]MCS3762090.1 MFS family permease [Bradyrhizobium centrosematis]MCS3774759.1 MFS family permease [Bradyrhizobium centrosematis]
MIDSKQASDALAEIDDTVRRVRQSLIYQVASLAMLMWGLLAFAGNIAGWLWPRYGLHFWIGLYAASIVGFVLIGKYHRSRNRIRVFDGRYLLTFLLIIAFGIFCCYFGQFTPRQQTAFWPIYVMLFYMMAGVWFGRAFLVIGATIVVLTLIGYYFIAGISFLLWMAMVNGGGLTIGGLWMRRN